jgi:hypothetical protein
MAKGTKSPGGRGEKGPGRSSGRGPNYRRPGGGGGGTGGNTGGTTHKGSAQATAPVIGIAFVLFIAFPSLVIGGILWFLVTGHQS